MDRQLDQDRVLQFSDGDPVKLTVDSQLSIVPALVTTFALIAIVYVAALAIFSGSL